MVCEGCVELLKRIEELEKELLSYKNAHTASSKIRFPPRITNENKEKAGHIGTTRTKPEPTITIEVVEKKCPHCKTIVNHINN